jgi:hypothetical protein
LGVLVILFRWAAHSPYISKTKLSNSNSLYYDYGYY